MPAEIFIRIRNLRKTYVMGKQTVHALAGVDLDIAAGSFTVVMGPSGSGKSTLLYLLGGLDRPTSGSITVNGALIEKLDENELAIYRRKTIGFIFQSFNLVPTMTALENVAFPMRFAGINQSQRRKRSMLLLRQVGLENRAYHRPTELSGGQQQRVAIARSMGNQPSIILADEPTGNLDTHSGYSIMQLLSELHRAGHTVVVVTHDPRMNHFSTNTIYLLDGQVVSEEEYQSASTFEFEAASKGNE
jgi:putative ABC transport system ATP-binding protein